MDNELSEAIEHLDHYGYCLLEDRMPSDTARRMAERFLELHTRPEYQDYILGDDYYQTLFGMLNLDDRVWPCAGHPDVLAVARHFLGPNCRVVEACSKPTWPDAPPQGLHADSTGNFLQSPDIPWMINTMWMLTDFTIDNGATGVVPMSHRSRMKTPPQDLPADLIKPITGRAGTVVLWHGGLFHIARANTSQDIRVGLNIAYYPRWFNNWIEGGHQPVWPETYARMPEEMQRLCTGKQGQQRADVYET